MNRGKNVRVMFVQKRVGNMEFSGRVRVGKRLAVVYRALTCCGRERCARCMLDEAGPRLQENNSFYALDGFAFVFLVPRLAAVPSSFVV